MIDANGSAVGPDSFLSAAVRYQMMPEIDRWVVNRAIDAAAAVRQLLAGRPLGVLPSISPASRSTTMRSRISCSTASQNSGINPEVFCFELTENATIANLARAEVVMRRLRRMGCGVALDDFGTGLSSLSYLRQLPVTMLKIDGSFVRDVLRDPRAESMVRAIAQLARTMSITTVAEYVETEEIRAAHRRARRRLWPGLRHRPPDPARGRAHRAAAAERCHRGTPRGRR